jgi:hypothetical protein
VVVGSGSRGVLTLLRKLSVGVVRNEVSVLRSEISPLPRVLSRLVVERVARSSVARVPRLEIESARVSDGTLPVLRVLRVSLRGTAVAAVSRVAVREVPGWAREMVGTPLAVVREGAGR